MSLEKARADISDIFRSTSWRLDGNIHRVLALLRQYPTLAGEQYIEMEHGLLYPLSLFVLSDEELRVVEEVFHLYPAAISEKQGNSLELPLHFATMRNSVQPDIVRFLAKHYPEAFSIRSDHGEWPIYYILIGIRRLGIQPMDHKRSPWIGTALLKLQFLLEQCPKEILLEKSDRLGLNILETAFSHIQCLEVFETILPYYPTGVADGSSFLIKQAHLTEERVEALFKLIPRLHQLTFDSVMWYSPAFIQFLRVLQSNDSITRMTLRLPRDELLADSSNNIQLNLFDDNQEPWQKKREAAVCARTELQKLLETNAALGYLHLCNRRTSGQSELMEDDKKILRVLVDGMKNNRSIEELELSRFQWHANRDDDSTLFELIASAPAPRILRLSEFSIRCTSVLQRPIANQLCRLERLDVSGGLILGKFFRDLLFQVSVIPTMKHVTVNCGILDPFASFLIDVTDGIAAILRENNVETLELLVGSVHVDIHNLCLALRENKVTKKLFLNMRYRVENLDDTFSLIVDTLNEDNTILEELDLPFMESSKYYDKIQHFLLMNKCGRCHARDPSTNMARFLDLLSTVTDAKARECVKNVFDVHHGLLKECPGLWSQI